MLLQMITKVCTVCHVEKSVDLFYKSKRFGHKQECKQCSNENNKLYRETHRKEIRAYWDARPDKICLYAKNHRDKDPERARAQRNKAAKTFLKNHPERILAYRLKKAYNMTSEDFLNLLTQQGGKCAICRADTPGNHFKTFCIDHDHETGEVRGLLCNNCNHGLGKFKDDITLLEAAVAYLHRHQLARVLLD